MLKLSKYIFLILLMMSLSSCSQKKEKNSLYNSSNSSKEKMEKMDYKNYNEAVKHFKSVEISQLLNHENFRNKFIFFGRITCPYCRNFAPILKNVAIKQGIEIYYVNTGSDNQSEDIKNVLNSYQIEEVPNLVYLNKEGKILRYSGDNAKDLKQFFNENKK